MHDRTPFRQLRKIYSSLLALGRLPTNVAPLPGNIASLRDNVAALRDVIAANGVAQEASLERLASKIEAIQLPDFSQLVAVPPPQPEVPSFDRQRALSLFREDLLSKIEQRLLCVDVGARWGVDSALLALKGKSKLLCFDPDEEECARLQQGHSLDDIEYVPLALSSDGRELTLTITREPACSSIYPPDEALYNTYPAMASTTPDRVVSIPSSSLDAFLSSRSMGKPHLFKIDTQGSELDILKGSIQNLADACMIDIEVEFNPMYKGQPLFADVDSFMREHGFALWRLPQMVHYPVETFEAAETNIEIIAHPPSRNLRTSPGNGQLFWGQAHYVRADCLPASQQPIDEQLALRMATIVGVYGYWDLALMCLEKCPDTASESALLRCLLT